MITILIALYNGKEYIKDTIDSALNQTIPVNILVIDDCSTDDSLSYVEELYSDTGKVRVIGNSQNIGFCKTVNKGLLMSVSDYILVLGQDDILSPDHCEKMIKYFDDNTSLVFCDFDLMDKNGITYETENHCHHREIVLRDLYCYNSIPSVGLIMKRDTLKSVGGYPENAEFPQYGEYHTWIRMVLAGKAVFCNKVRAKYRRHNTNMTNNFSDKKVKRKLNRYNNSCKMQLLKSDKICIEDKIYILIRMVYSTMKAYINI